MTLGNGRIDALHAILCYALDTSLNQHDCSENEIDQIRESFHLSLAVVSSIFRAWARIVTSNIAIEVSPDRSMSFESLAIVENLRDSSGQRILLHVIDSCVPHDLLEEWIAELHRCLVGFFNIDDLELILEGHSSQEVAANDKTGLRSPDSVYPTRWNKHSVALAEIDSVALLRDVRQECVILLVAVVPLLVRLQVLRFRWYEEESLLPLQDMVVDAASTKVNVEVSVAVGNRHQAIELNLWPLPLIKLLLWPDLILEVNVAYHLNRKALAILDKHATMS